MSEQTEQQEQAGQTQDTSPTQEQTQEASPDASTPNLEALMHVPLEVSVELGRLKMPLHQVVRLGRGMVLKLQKEADAAVDILANGAVFARGEVVKADGKLGVRITDVVPAAERIRAIS